MNPNKDNSTIQKQLKAFSKYSEQEQENILLALTTISPLLLDLNQALNQTKSENKFPDLRKRIPTPENSNDQSSSNSSSTFERQKGQCRKDLASTYLAKKQLPNPRQSEKPLNDNSVSKTKTKKQFIAGYHVIITEIDIDPRSRAKQLRQVAKIFEIKKLGLNKNKIV